MIIQTNYQPDITVISDWKTDRIAYAKKHAKNRKHLRAFLLDIKRFRGNEKMFFPGGASFTPCLNKYFKKLAKHREQSGYRRLTFHEHYHMKPSPIIRGIVYDMAQVIVCKKSCKY